MYYMRACLTGDMSCRSTCRHEDRFYRMACYAGGYVLLEDMW